MNPMQNKKRKFFEMMINARRQAQRRLLVVEKMWYYNPFPRPDYVDVVISGDTALNPRSGQVMFHRIAGKWVWPDDVWKSKEISNYYEILGTTDKREVDWTGIDITQNKAIMDDSRAKSEESASKNNTNPDTNAGRRGSDTTDNSDAK